MVTTIGPDGTTYVPVIDISRHQGVVDFAVMRAKGVEGVIIRSNHAQVVDDRAAEYVTQARAAGFRDDQLGFYTFCNPKRATGAASGKAMVDTVRRIFGHTDTIFMLDIEAYATEPGAGPEIYGPPFAAWIREHIAAIRAGAPDGYVIAYSNAAYWNPKVGDPALAAELEWIVPRYPVYPPATVRDSPPQLATWVLTSSKPPTPSGWAGWAFSKAAGPFPPQGARWHGWQFSAGWNRQGLVYGCSSSDLDLNIVRADAWARWTDTDIEQPNPAPSPPIGEPMAPYVFRLADGSVGVRHEAGARHVNDGELQGPLKAETVWPVAAGSAWEAWIKRELGRYERELDPPTSTPGGGGDHQVLVTVEARAVQ